MPRLASNVASFEAKIMENVVLRGRVLSHSSLAVPTARRRREANIFFVFWWLWSRCNGGWVVKFLHPEITNYVTRSIRRNPLEECSTAFNPLKDIS